MHFAAKSALGLVVSSFALATAAYADSAYQPYYAQDSTPENYQFSTAPAPAPAPTITPAQQAAYADSYYQPYYAADSARDNYQFSNAPVAAPASAQQPSPYAVSSQTAPAQPSFTEGLGAIHRSDNDVSLSFGGEYMNYKETISPIPDSERGWMPSFAVGADYLSRNNWFLSGQGSIAFGDAPYEGALQNGYTETPYNGWTHETIADISGKFGKGFDLGENSMIIPYGELGLRYWDRDLRGQYGYVEDYSRFDGLGGLMFQTSPIERLVLSIYGSYGLTFDNKMKTEAVPDFRLGSTGMYKTGGKISYALTPRFDIFTTMDFSHFRNVASELEPDLNYPVPNRPNYYYAVQEPSSFTNEMTSRVGIAYHFF